MSATVMVRVNGEDRTEALEPRTHLADFVRDALLLTGTHLGCEHGVCGACTLMLDGKPVRSCLTLAASCAGAEIRTIEGFDEDALMAALRSAFSRHHALQCGYCTPGMLVTAYDIVRRLPGADETRVRAELAGNLCRCTGYAGIVAAIMEVAADPPDAAIQPTERVLVATTPAPRTARTEPPPGVANAWREPDLSDAATLSRELHLPFAADQAWSLLRSVETVIGCVPGATLLSRDGEFLQAKLAVAVGPMRPEFLGSARVRYDEAARTGLISGIGDDPATRSSATGELGFRVANDGDAACIVATEIRYSLRGPLAQAGRPAVVAAVTDALLERLGRNLESVASGGAADQRPMSALRTAAALLAALRRLLRR